MNLDTTYSVGKKQHDAPHTMLTRSKTKKRKAAEDELPSTTEVRKQYIFSVFQPSYDCDH